MTSKCVFFGNLGTVSVMCIDNTYLSGSWQHDGKDAPEVITTSAGNYDYTFKPSDTTYTDYLTSINVIELTFNPTTYYVGQSNDVPKAYNGDTEVEGSWSDTIVTSVPATIPLTFTPSDSSYAYPVEITVVALTFNPTTYYVGQSNDVPIASYDSIVVGGNWGQDGNSVKKVDVSMATSFNLMFTPHDSSYNYTVKITVLDNIDYLDIPPDVITSGFGLVINDKNLYVVNKKKNVLSINLDDTTYSIIYSNVTVEWPAYTNKLYVTIDTDIVDLSGNSVGVDLTNLRMDCLYSNNDILYTATSTNVIKIENGVSTSYAYSTYALNAHINCVLATDEGVYFSTDNGIIYTFVNGVFTPFFTYYSQPSNNLQAMVIKDDYMYVSATFSNNLICFNLQNTSVYYTFSCSLFGGLAIYDNNLYLSFETAIGKLQLPLNIIVFNSLPSIYYTDVSYTLPEYSSTPSLPGVWSPSNTINTSNPGTFNYTFTSTDTTYTTYHMVIVVKEQNSTTFDSLGPYYLNQIVPLPTSSNQNVSGSWTFNGESTKVVLTTITPSLETPSYVFTPSNPAYKTYTTEIMIENIIFDPTTYYVGQSNDVPIASDGTTDIPGKWEDQDGTTTTVNVNTIGVFTYTFTPTDIPFPIPVIINVVDLKVPTFKSLGPYYVDQKVFLPTVSTNNISGTWSVGGESVSFVDTSITGVFGYTFTPYPGQNATSTTVTIIVKYLEADICFPAGTLIQTDQGQIAIEYIDTSIHTIKNKPIIHITKTITTDDYLVGFKKNALGVNKPYENTIMSKDHRILYLGSMYKADTFLGFKNVTAVKYTGELLYNVLMHDHSTINVNGLICETLHPDNAIAKLYKLYVPELQ